MSVTLAGPVLTCFRNAVTEAYGPARTERVVLFGSRARGDANDESDYDVAVFLRDLGDPFAEMDRLADISTSILNDTGLFIHAIPYPAGSYRNRTPLMAGVREDMIDI